MSNLEMWSAIVGFFLPLAIAFLVQQHWPEALRAALAFAACCVAAAGTAYFQGNLNFERWVESALIILTVAMAMYRNVWKPTGIAPVIDNKTTLANNRKPVV